MKLHLTIEERPYSGNVPGASTEFRVALRDTAVEVTLPAAKLARGLSDMALLVAATGGAVTEGLRRHFEGHFAATSTPEGRCEFCKLQGRVLRAQGRRRLREEEDRVRVIPAGVTAAARDTALERAKARETERLRRLPKLGSAKRGAAAGAGADTEVWF